MKKVLSFVLTIIFAFSLSGCAAVLVGGGVAGGIAISKDTARIEKDANVDETWEAAKKVLSDMGLIEYENKSSGKIDATIKDSKVNVEIKQITASAISIEVKARKNLFPNMDLAIEILNKIDDAR